MGISILTEAAGIELEPWPHAAARGASELKPLDRDLAG